MENWTVLNELFEPNLIKELEKTSKQINVQAGNTILEIGEIVRHIPIILDGSVKVSRIDEDNRELLLYYVNPKESCAMTFTCCMQQNPSEIRAVAEDDVQMLAVPIEVMDKWLNKFPSWKNFVMKTIHIRFTELLKAIDQIAFQKLDERLITYLKEKSKATNSTLVNLSHQQIADELATSRVVISRLLKSLENENKLLLYRNQIKILKAL
ncbi:MAG: Crp/Fnr family transcriptional regulator [Bacteroidetes bacterium]|nr:Crp/Fnr family transcriptional regulator [Bacteroidota bacterium]